MLQNVELKDTDNADDDLFHTGVVFLEDLDGTFLGDLLDSFDELLSLHGIHLTHACEMLRCKSRDTLILNLVSCHADRISDGENARIEKSDNISCISLFHDLTILRHHLLRLGQTDLLAALNVVYLHTGLELAGYNTHERDTVTVRLVHICLDFKDKRGKIIGKRTDFSCDSPSRQWRSSHLQEMLQKGLYTKVGQSGTEKYRR